MNGLGYGDGIAFGDFVGVLSLLLGYENLLENREQSKQNNVSAANDAQAKYLLQELGRKFDEQNNMLGDIIGRLEALESERDQRDSVLH